MSSSHDSPPQHVGRPLRILYCIPTLSLGGCERRIVLLASELARRGHDVHVAATRGGPLSAALRLTADRLHLLLGFGNHDPRTGVRLWQLTRSVEPDLLHTCLPQMDVLGGLVARLTGRPFVMMEPSCREAYPRSWKNRLRQSAAASAAAIVANSEGGAACWPLRRRRSPCFVVRNGIHPGIEAISPAPPPGRDDERLVLFVGRFDAGKNVETLVRGLALASRCTSFRALLCGDGPLRQRVLQLIGSLGLRGRVDAPGSAGTPWALMKRAAAFVSVSLFEGQPNAVLEAMACGAPLVVSDIPAHREFLDEACGVFVRPHDPAAVAAGLSAVLSDPVAAGERAAEARRRVEPLTVEAMADAYERIYRAVLDPGAPLPAGGQLACGSSPGHTGSIRSSSVAAGGA